MRSQIICLALVIALLCPFASAQWMQTTGPNRGKILALAFSGQHLLAGTDSGVFRYTNNGTKWAVVDSGLMNTYVDCLAGDSLTLFAGTWGGGVFRSSDNGTNWTAVNTGLTNGNIISLLVIGMSVFASTSSGVFLSTDSGTSWSAVKPGLSYESFIVLAGGPISIGVSTTNVFGGTSRDGVFLSTDSGSSWNPVNNGLPPPVPILEIGYPTINALFFSGTDLLAGTDAGVFLTSDNGTRWTASDTGITMGWVVSFSTSGANIFAGSFGQGVFRSTDNGRIWIPVNTGLTNTSVHALVASDKDLFAGTFDGGVWWRPLSEITTNMRESEAPLPGRFWLSQNYPNPFNPSTTIKYELPRASLVNLSVFDILGREVSVLVNERRDAGVYEVKFDGSNLASGVYFYRLQAGDFVQTKRLLILK